jgi:Domain of unknown function (DUF4258)
MVGAAQPHYVLETQILRRVANNPNCSWRFTKHALQEMDNDRWNADDVKYAVMNGRVILEEQKRDVLWRVLGRDIDGGQIQVVVAVDEGSIEIKVVTTF